MSISRKDREILGRHIDANWQDPKVHGSVRIPKRDDTKESKYLNAAIYHRVIYAALRMTLNELQKLRQFLVGRIKDRGLSIYQQDMSPDLQKSLQYLGINGKLDATTYDGIISDAIKIVGNAIYDSIMDDNSGIDIGTITSKTAYEIAKSNIDLDPGIFSSAEVIRKEFMVAAAKTNNYDVPLLNTLYVAEVFVGNTIASMEEATRGPGQIDILSDLSMSGTVSLDDAYNYRKPSHNKNTESKKTIWKKNIGEYLKDCIPCEARFKATGDWFDSLKKLEFGKGIREAVLRNALGIVSAMNWTLGEYYLSTNICSIVLFLVDAVCIPDFISIVAILKILLAKLQPKNFDLSISINGDMTTLSKLIIYPILEYIFNLLVSAVGQILSPAKCIVDHLTPELDKIAALNHAPAALVPKIAKYEYNPWKALSDMLIDLSLIHI